MPGRGPAPAANRRRRNKPARGEWAATPGSGWQHSEVIPEPPDGLSEVSLDTWRTWFASWFAANWMPSDLPGLRIVIGLYEQCESYRDDPYTERTTRGGDSMFVLKPNPVTELRQLMDNYGITPKGQQDRRWVRDTTAPEAPARSKPRAGKPAAGKPAQETAAPYRHLSVVAGGKA